MSMESKSHEIIVIAGGTGLIGKSMVAYFKQHGHEVRVLSRKPSQPQNGLFHWDPAKKVIDSHALEGVTTLINLSGVGIADARWTASRKQEIIESRVLPTLFLAEITRNNPTLKQYISASGINCYGYENPTRMHEETDAFGTDYLSQVVEKWEQAADAFVEICPVAKIRISVVLTSTGGAVETMAKPVRMGFSAALGSGKQWMPWIHYRDLIRMFDQVMLKRASGAFNAVGKVVNNADFMDSLTTSLGKKRWLPNAPGFVLKIALGEMASMLLNGVNASNEAIKNTGFQFDFEEIDAAFQDLFGKK